MTHGSDISILRNRVGSIDASNPNDYGYGDNGFDITLSDSGQNLHDYQNDTAIFNLDWQLTGTWAHDGRDTSPFTVTDATTPTAMLDAFNGQDADSTWTLSIAAVSLDGVGALDDWSIQVNGDTSSSGVTDLANTASVLFFVIRFFFVVTSARFRWRPWTGPSARLH